MSLAPVGDVELAYTTMGNPQAPPVLLIAGLSGQLISWDDEFCRLLVDRGLFVVRFDNRDVGLSTHVDDAAGAEVPGAQAPVYALADLAADAAGLIDALGLGSAHVVGVSMGGMIVQILAIEHPERVRSLTSIMSTTGDPDVGEATAEAIALLMSPPLTSREQVLEESVLAHRVLGSPAFPLAEDQLRDRAARSFDRCYYPDGVARQLHACLTTPDRTEALGRLDLPTLVIHGVADPLISVTGGRATAAAIRGAELLEIDGMGHDLPAQVWPTVVDRIVALIERAEQARGTA